MPTFSDETGKRYGSLVFLSFVGRNKHKSALWLVRCDCGSEKVVVANAIKNGNTKSCGCVYRATRKDAGLRLASRAKEAASSRISSRIAAGEKTCSWCKKVKTLEAFMVRARNPDGRDNWCRVCSHESDIWKNYRITADEYRTLLSDSDGLCAICGGRDSYGRKRLAVDHDHQTGIVRGILCYKCNTGIGLFLHDPTILRKAIVYLRRPRENAIRMRPRKAQRPRKHST